MNLRIIDCEMAPHDVEAKKVFHVWFSPKKDYVVAEIIYGETFVVGRVLEYDELAESLTLCCLDLFTTDHDEVDLFSYKMDWSDLPHGFCKLNCSRLESWKQDTYRIYVDPELYKKSYEEKNGVPYQGNKSFRRCSRRCLLGCKRNG